MTKNTTIRVGDLRNPSFNPDTPSPFQYRGLEVLCSHHSERKVQRVLLISPSATLYKGDLPRCTYPLGLGYIASVLEANGYTVQILDCLVEGYEQQTPIDNTGEFIRYGLCQEQIAPIIEAFAPDVVGVSSIFSNQADVVGEIFDTARRVAPKAKLATGGAHARYFPMNYLEDIGLDAVFLGESEATFLDYLEYLNGSLELSALSNVMIKTEGKIYKNDTMVLIRRKYRDHLGNIAEIDEIPYPAWHLYNMEKYFSIGAYQSPYTIGNRVGQIYTSRGCTAKCTFCTTTNFWGGKLRRRSPANVVGELEILKREYLINEFHIQDDNITNDKVHAKSLFRQFKEINLPWCTPQGTALWRMDEELLDLMAESGCYQVTFAIESGVQRVLDDLIRKPLDLQRTKHLIAYARRAGMDVHGFFIIGMPPMFGHSGETLDEMHQTFAFAHQAEFDSASFFTATPIVGSVLLDECLRQGFLPPDTPLYQMSYKQGLISVPGLWNGHEVAALAANFNAAFNSEKRRRVTAREWSSKQY